jgi:uncharacterized protein YbcI
MAEQPKQAATEVEAQIGREILRVHEESYGYGASDVQVVVADDLVVVVLDVDITRAEETLLEAGRGQAVRSNREAFQKAIEPVFKAVIERATGRQVRAFLSQMHTDPLFSVEIFRLEPH